MRSRSPRLRRQALRPAGRAGLDQVQFTVLTLGHEASPWQSPLAPAAPLHHAGPAGDQVGQSIGDAQRVAGSDDIRPTAARTAKSVTGYRQYCPLRKCRNHGDRSNYTVEHVLAADRLRQLADAVAIGFFPGCDSSPVQAICDGPLSGFGRAAVRSALRGRVSAGDGAVRSRPAGAAHPLPAAELVAAAMGRGPARAGATGQPGHRAATPGGLPRTPGRAFQERDRARPGAGHGGLDTSTR